MSPAPRLPDLAQLFLSVYLAISVFGPGRSSLSQALSRLLPTRGLAGFLLR